jgi:hypothetical protein
MYSPLNGFRVIKIGFGKLPKAILSFGQKNGFRVTNGKFDPRMI